MKALVLADLHTRDELKFIDPRHLKECECIILVGDTTASKRYEHPDLGTRKDFNFVLPTIGVLGNHENWELIKAGNYGLRNVHKQIMQYKGLKFAGVGGVIAQRPRRIYHNSLPDIVTWMNSLIKRKKKIDIFIIHEPPVGCFDYIRGRNRGVQEYRGCLEKLRPKYIFVAHMHTYRGMISWNADTMVINSGVGIRGEYAVLDTKKDKINFYP